MLRVRVHWGLEALCALTCFLLAGGTASAIGVSSPKCRALGSETLAHDPHARIYSLPTRGPIAARDPESVRVFGCLFGSGRPLLLGTAAFAGRREGRIGTAAIDVATPMVAYSSTFQGVDFNVVSVVVRNLRNGEEVGEFGAARGRGVEQITSVTDIEVAGTGAVAWISTAHLLGSGRRAAEVVVAGPHQGVEVLDEGEGIDPESLELRGSTLTWSDEGTPHSAPMP